MDWTDGPATFKQLRFLERHGFKPGHPLTRTEASDMILRFGGRPEEFANLAKPEVPAGDTSVGQTPYDFRVAVANAKQLLADANPGSRSFRQNSVNAALARRQQFWLDTCSECGQMHFASRSVIGLHQKHGCLYVTPTAAQVQEILDALDSAMPFWDRDCPEFFYQTLSLNFPQLLRRH